MPTASSLETPRGHTFWQERASSTARGRFASQRGHSPGLRGSAADFLSRLPKDEPVGADGAHEALQGVARSSAVVQLALRPDGFSRPRTWSAPERHSSTLGPGPALRDRACSQGRGQSHIRSHALEDEAGNRLSLILLLDAPGVCRRDATKQAPIHGGVRVLGQPSTRRPLGLLPRLDLPD